MTAVIQGASVESKSGLVRLHAEGLESSVSWFPSISLARTVCFVDRADGTGGLQLQRDCNTHALLLIKGMIDESLNSHELQACIPMRTEVISTVGPLLPDLGER